MRDIAEILETLQGFPQRRGDRMKVYLAGPINGCTDTETFNWRRHLIHRMPNTNFVDPTVRDYRGDEDANVAAIVEQDKADIDGCSIVVAYCPKPSVGTSMEVLYAWQQGKHIIAWTPPGAPVSPWLRYHSHSTHEYMVQVESAIGARLLGVPCSTSPTPVGTQS